jgi:glyoxylase-like metal-dependent hydrolase (beta-lactamase superfamily II)
VKPAPPTITLTETMTLYRGGREIRLLFLGRGHTGGDIVVYLPKERVVATGDLLVAALSYLGDAYVEEWGATLDRLRALDFDWVLPGHGDAFQGKDKIGQFQAYLTDFWQQARKLHDAGVSAEDAARRIDLRSHAANYPTAAALKEVGVLNHGVYRAYDQIDGRIK